MVHLNKEVKVASETPSEAAVSLVNNNFQIDKSKDMVSEKSFSEGKPASSDEKKDTFSKKEKYRDPLVRGRRTPKSSNACDDSEGNDNERKYMERERINRERHQEYLLRKDPSQRRRKDDSRERYRPYDSHDNSRYNSRENLQERSGRNSALGRYPNDSHHSRGPSRDNSPSRVNAEELDRSRKYSRKVEGGGRPPLAPTRDNKHSSLPPDEEELSSGEGRSYNEKHYRDRYRKERQNRSSYTERPNYKSHGRRYPEGHYSDRSFSWYGDLRESKHGYRREPPGVNDSIASEKNDRQEVERHRRHDPVGEERSSMPPRPDSATSHRTNTSRAQASAHGMLLLRF